MDDDLLADDGQYKDDGLDDLDIDAEAALLGLSDEEIEDERCQNDDQELEYVDEDGNPVSIGENNADLYEVANIESDKQSNPADEDVLELDLDTELDSFNQETSDLLSESPTPTKSYNERQRKENLISLTNRKEQERPPLRRKESRYSPEKDQDRSNKDVSFNQSHTSGIEHRDSYDDELEFDEESEDENIADDHRERFKSERSNIITLTPAKRRSDIPDTLESVISVEETAKVQAFLENEQKRKMRFKGKMHGRMKPSPRFQRPAQNFSSTQGQQLPPFSNSNPASVSQPVSTTPQPRKILINPHFRGIRIPPATDPMHTLNETPQASVPPPPPSSYETPNFPPPVQYSHQESVLPVSVAPPPIYTAPPPTVQYKHPEYPPQQPLQQIPPPAWQPPDMTQQSYSMPPPVMNYGDPPPQPPNYNNYNQNYQNANYQSPSMPMPHSVNYTQPPPPVHLYTQSFPAPPLNPVSSSMTHTQFSPAPSQMRMQTISQQQPYQETSMSQPQMASHASHMKPKFTPSHQRFSRPPEKRLSNSNIKHVPLKQARMEHPQRKTNIHVNNSNIREIPLVDTLPTTRKTTAIKTVPIVEDEDEKTKELRMKIEEQKLLREQILKRKEERRRQMAAQRLSELKKRQAEQNKNTVTIIPKALNQNIPLKNTASVKPVVKPSVKERIGLPLNKNVSATKKKIVVVRKKLQQNPIVVPPNNAKPPPIVGQRLKLPVPSQRQNVQQITKPTASTPATTTTNTTTAVTSQQNNNKQISIKKPVAGDSSRPSVPTKKEENKLQTTVINQKNQPTNPSKKIVLTSQAQKGRTLRLGNRPPLQRPQFSQLHRMHRPRVPGPRGGQFTSPFGEHRMPFLNHGPPPMNEMRMPPPHFQDSRPPLLPFHPPGDHGPFNNFFPRDMPFEPNSPPFRMRGPGLPNFRPGAMEPMFHDRFPPPPQFRNQMPQMRHMLENNNMPRFQRPRFHHQGKQKFPPNSSINSNQKSANVAKTAETKPSASVPVSQAPGTNQKSNVTAGKKNEMKPVSKTMTQNQPKNVSDDKDIPKTQSVSIENLSSSTNEAQLRKLCSTVGVVENIQLLKSERKAVIKFKEPRQALNFQKKYQRYMLDLAMIQVSLLSS